MWWSFAAGVGWLIVALSTLPLVIRRFQRWHRNVPQSERAWRIQWVVSVVAFLTAIAFFVGFILGR